MTARAGATGDGSTTGTTEEAHTVLSEDRETLVNGYRSTCADVGLLLQAPDTTTDEYDREQRRNNVRVVREFLVPVCRRLGSRRVLDVGCGVGTAVQTLLAEGYDAYGVDLPGLTPYWTRDGCSPERFSVVAPVDHRLPFEDDSLDLVYSFGVQEHIGTLDGHSLRAPDYHAQRRQWVAEMFRCVRPGGCLLLGGPNKGFPLDFSHGLDAGATWVERKLSSLCGFSVHRTWGSYFLWSYADVARYLAGLDFRVEPLSIGGLLRFGRVPAWARWLAGTYVRHLPRPLLGTGFNPWVMALVHKRGKGRTSR